MTKVMIFCAHIERMNEHGECSVWANSRTLVEAQSKEAAFTFAKKYFRELRSGERIEVYVPEFVDHICPLS